MTAWTHTEKNVVLQVCLAILYDAMFPFPSKICLHYFKREIREKRQSDFICTAVLQFLSEYFTNFKTLHCFLSGTSAFIRNYGTLNTVCMISLFLSAIYFAHLLDSMGLMSFCVSVQFDQIHSSTVCFLFKFFSLILMLTSQPRNSPTG